MLSDVTQFQKYAGDYALIQNENKMRLVLLRANAISIWWM